MFSLAFNWLDLIWIFYEKVHSYLFSTVDICYCIWSSNLFALNICMNCVRTCGIVIFIQKQKGNWTRLTFLIKSTTTIESEPLLINFQFPCTSIVFCRYFYFFFRLFASSLCSLRYTVRKLSFNFFHLQITNFTETNRSISHNRWDCVVFTSFSFFFFKSNWKITANVSFRTHARCCIWFLTSTYQKNDKKIRGD